MARRGIILAAVVVFVLVASQLLLPALGERKVEDRLTEGGGSADVTLGAVPALRLLFGEGERFEVSAHDLDLELDQRSEVFDRLDGFSIVDVSIENSTAGPIELDSFELTRETPNPYHLISTGQASPSELVDYGLEGVELPGVGLLDAIFGQLLGPSEASVPVKLDMELTSEDGRVRVVSGGGTVAGIPSGPLAELITAAIVVRL
jgi:hypothetical protein